MFNQKSDINHSLTIIFHIGWSKTGTTALQSWLSANSDTLIDHGYLYPETGRWKEGSHHELALSLRPIIGYKSKKSAEHLWSDLKKEILKEVKKKKVSKVIISSELFPPLYEYAVVVNFLNDLNAKGSILATVREQVDLIKSMQKQLVRDPAVAIQWNVYQLFKDHRNNYLYSEVLEKYRDSYPWSEIIVLQYGPAIVQTVINRLGIKDGQLPDDRKNVSISYAQTEIIRRLNTVALPLEKRKEINHIITGMSDIISINEEILPELTEKHKEEIISFYRDSNTRLLEEFGVNLLN